MENVVCRHRDQNESFLLRSPVNSSHIGWRKYWWWEQVSLEALQLVYWGEHYKTIVLLRCGTRPGEQVRNPWINRYFMKLDRITLYLLSIFGKATLKLSLHSSYPASDIHYVRMKGPMCDQYSPLIVNIWSIYGIIIPVLLKLRAGEYRSMELYRNFHHYYRICPTWWVKRYFWLGHDGVVLGVEQSCRLKFTL